jgi:hypothetical protein
MLRQLAVQCTSVEIKLSWLMPANECAGVVAENNHNFATAPVAIVKFFTQHNLPMLKDPRKLTTGHRGRTRRGKKSHRSHEERMVLYAVRQSQGCEIFSIMTNALHRRRHSQLSTPSSSRYGNIRGFFRCP